MEKKVTLTIDGQEVSVNPGQTVLRPPEAWAFTFQPFATMPTLPMSAPAASASSKWKTPALWCLVLHAVSPGMVVRTNTPAVRAAQKMIIELLWSSGDHNCLTCEQNGACEAAEPDLLAEIDKPRFPIEPPGHAMDESNTMITRDLNKAPVRPLHPGLQTKSRSMKCLDFSMRGSYRRSAAFDTDYIDSTACSAANASRFAPPAPSRSNRRSSPAVPGSLKKSHHLRVLWRRLPDGSLHQRQQDLKVMGTGNTASPTRAASASKGVSPWISSLIPTG